MALKGILSGLLINSAINMKFVQGTVGSFIWRREREPGGFHRKGDTCGRTRSRYQMSKVGKSVLGREQD